MEIRRVKKHDVDMTSGSVFRHLLNFAVPLLMGNIFQQLYNTVDTWVVGNYVSNEAFSAVGTVAPIINTLIGAFAGLASGAGVVISQYYGAGKYDRVKDAVHTAVMMTLVLSVAFTAIGIAMTPNMLRLMKTPAEVFPESRAYLNIYFSGMTGLMLYNMGAGILRAVLFAVAFRLREQLLELAASGDRHALCARLVETCRCKPQLVSERLHRRAQVLDRRPVRACRRELRAGLVDHRADPLPTLLLPLLLGAGELTLCLGKLLDRRLKYSVVRADKLHVLPDHVFPRHVDNFLSLRLCQTQRANAAPSQKKEDE